MQYTKYKILLFVLMTSLVCLLYMSTQNTTELYQNNIVDTDIEVIIARYNEDLDWLRDEMFNRLVVTIYNKGPNDNFYKPPNLKQIVQLPNVGVCDHTYLYHIVANYDNLAKVTVFLPGSCMDRIKGIKTINILNQTIKTKNSMFYGYYEENGVLNNLKDFVMKAYQTTNDKNKMGMTSNDSIPRQCDAYPYGNWFQEVFGNIMSYYATYYGIFSVSKEHIHNRPKGFYEKLINYVNKNKNEECSHYMERSYITIFKPSDECIRIVKVMKPPK